MMGGPIAVKLWRYYCQKHLSQSIVYLAIRNCSSNVAARYKYSEKDVKEFNFVTHILKPWVNKRPNHCALWLSDENESIKISYRDLLLTSQHLANSLNKMGSPKCALVILDKISPWWTINIAGSYTGMIISPGTKMLTENEIKFRLERCNADTIFCTVDLMHKYEKVVQNIPHKIVVEEKEENEPKDLGNGWILYHKLLEEGKNLKNVQPIKDGDSIAQLFFTSGTTGKPKMVPHTQAGYGIGHQEGAWNIFSVSSSDVFWNLSDLGWAKAAYNSLYIPLIVGCTMYVHKMERFDPKLVIKTLMNEPITAFCCPPTALRSIIQEDLSQLSYSALKRVFSAGEPLNPEVVEIWTSRTGIPIFEMYGQTETTVLAGTKPNDIQKPGSMGKPVSHFNVVIIDDDFKELDDNKVGQIAISLKEAWPYGLCKEYYKSIDQTKKSFVNEYYLTGDKAFRDEDGYLWYVGRGDDIIISAGYRIGPFEVESALLEHPAVGESAVVASPDPFRGHVVKAFIVLTEKYTSYRTEETRKNELITNIQEFIKRTIAPYKYPRKIEFVENLPKTVSGKIRRVELRENEFH